MSRGAKYEDPQFAAYNESLDEEGVVNIAGIEFKRSQILFDLAKVTYEEGYGEFLEEQFKELQQTIFDLYPANIAYHYRLSEKGQGAKDPVKKLFHLKDSWEAMVYVLYAIVMGEVRFRNMDLTAVAVIVGSKPDGTPIIENFNTDRILTEAIKIKIQNIKAIIEHCKKHSLGFICETIDVTLCDDLLALQDIRNDISHHAMPTKLQAEAELKMVIPLFEGMLEKTRFLGSCKILRFENHSTETQCESFNGYSLNQEFEDHIFVDPHKTYVLGLGKEHLFAEWKNECFSLSPFLHFDIDASGHESYISFYKRKKDGKYWFEPIKARAAKSFDPLNVRFESEKDGLLVLLRP
jgi:hypothetical protein